MEDNLGSALKGMTPQDLPDVVCDECSSCGHVNDDLLPKNPASPLA